MSMSDQHACTFLIWTYQVIPLRVCTNLNTHQQCHQHTKLCIADSKVNKGNSKIQHKIKQK